MTKQKFRNVLTYLFLLGLKEVIKTDSDAEVVNVRVLLKPKPDYSKTSTFNINYYQIPNDLWTI